MLRMKELNDEGLANHIGSESWAAAGEDGGGTSLVGGPMAPYSMDLRQRVARAWDGVLAAETIAAKYEVSPAGCAG
jgi:hypothetical protein